MRNRRTCEHCGRPLPPRTSKRGRPPVYHPTCKRFSQLLGWLSQLSESVEHTPAAAKQVRADLFLLANTLRVEGNGDDKALGVALRRWRLWRELRQADVAQSLRCTRRRVGKLEAGEARWTEAERRAMREAMAAIPMPTQ